MTPSSPHDWDARFREPGFWCGEEPLEFLVQHLALLPAGRALDLAAGEGRNAVCLAAHGYHVVAIERSKVGIEKARARAGELGLTIEFREQDLEQPSLPEGEFDVVVCSNYLQRSLFGPMERALRPGGALVMQTYTLAQQSREQGPKSPGHLLEPGELFRAFRHMHVSFYREVDDGRRAVASLLAYRL